MEKNSEEQLVPKNLSEPQDGVTHVTEVSGENTQAPKHKDNKLLAIISMNFAALTITGMTATYRIVGEEGFHAAEFNLIRNTTGFIASCLWCWLAGLNPIKAFPHTKKQALFWRTFTGQINFLLLNISATMAPIALIMVCWQTSPFWISIVAFCFLSEPIFPLEIIAMIICSSAVAIIAHQSLKADDTAVNTEQSEDSMETFIGLMLALFASLMMAFLAVSTRYLKEVPTPVIIFYYTAGGFIVTLIYVLIEMLITREPNRFTTYTARQMLIALAASLCDTASLFCVTIAYQADSSGFVSLISYMNIVYGYICDQFIFDLELKAVQLIAAIVILCTALGVAFYKLVKQRQKKATVEGLEEGVEGQVNNGEHDYDDNFKRA